MKLLLIILFGSIPFFSVAAKIKNGTYNFQITYEEWSGKIVGYCEVKIKNDSVFVYDKIKHELLNSGILIQHQSGVWIVAKSANDKSANPIGACADGPMIINLKKRVIYFC